MLNRNNVNHSIDTYHSICLRRIHAYGPSLQRVHLFVRSRICRSKVFTRCLVHLSTLKPRDGCVHPGYHCCSVQALLSFLKKSFHVVSCIHRIQLHTYDVRSLKDRREILGEQCAEHSTAIYRHRSRYLLTTNTRIRSHERL